jgi:glycosyltransferase involved in cell wall biosynthesis
MAQAAPLRILHLTSGSDAGGVSRYIYDLCLAMHEAGHQVAVAGGHGAWQKLFQGAPWPWVDVSFQRGPLGLARSATMLRSWLDEHPVDLLHTHYRRPTLVARQLQRKLKLPILYTLHLSHIPLRIPWRWFTDFGDHVHAPSTDGRAWLMQHRVAAERITVIPHGIDADKFPLPAAGDRANARAALGLHPHDRAALFVGRLDKPKNEDWMLDLAAANAVPNPRVFIAGDGPHFDWLQRRIVSQNLSDRVTLLGHRDPLPLYHAADALLLPSAREGFSYVCAEAMCAGVPVLRTRTSGTAELIVEGVTGRSTPIDRVAFLNAAVDFLSDQPALERMGQAAAQHIRAHFTFSNQLHQTVALYRRLISSRV